MVKSLLICGAMTVAAAAQRVVVLEEGLNGYTGFEDATIYSDGDLSFGGGEGIVSGTIKNNPFHRRALLRTSFEFIPKNTEVLDCSLSLFVDRSGGNFGDIDYRVHRLLKPWGEGNVGHPPVDENDPFPPPPGQGLPAEAGDATWLSNQHGVSTWDIAGGDFDSSESALATVGRQDTWGVWSGTGLASNVQGWIAVPAFNYGWILISSIEGSFQRVKLFRSSEASANRPRITLTLDLDPGDVDLDGALSARDVQLVVNALYGNGPNGFLADVTGDGLISNADLELVSNRVTRLAKRR